MPSEQLIWLKDQIETNPKILMKSMILEFNLEKVNEKQLLEEIIDEIYNDEG